MDIQVIIVAFSVLTIAWALERLFAKIQSMERHIKGIRARLNRIERQSSNPKQKTESTYRQTLQPNQTRKSTQPQPQQQTITPQQQQSNSQHETGPRQQTSQQVNSRTGKTVICSFCGVEFDFDLTKCPSCHHINIEKYRIHKKDTSDTKFDV